VRLGIGIAAALAVAHASGVIHRDIKPDNILLDAEGEAIVADFGLARALASGVSPSATHQVQGTPHYFSPEQARGQEVDGRSDLYALGVTLYRAATGRLPFEGDDWYVVARQHIETPPPPPRTIVDDLTPEFDALLLRLLAKEPQERFANALQVVDALAALPTAPARGLGVARLGSNTIEAFQPAPARPAPWPVLAGGAVLVVLAIWLTNRQDPASAVNGVPAPTPAPVMADTGPVRDTALTVGAVPRPESARVVPVVPVDSTRRPARDSGVRRQPAALAKVVRLDVETADSAEVYIDNRRVGRGSWTGEHAPAARLSVRAVLAEESIACTSAMNDTVLAPVRAGQRLTIALPVRPCIEVRFDVRPRDARVAIRPLDGGRELETRADSALALSLPVGRYEVRTSAPRCITITDTLVAARTGDGAPVSRRLRLLCS
jgi:serine/threonine-protein kinase